MPCALHPGGERQSVWGLAVWLRGYEEGRYKAGPKALIWTF